MMNRILQMLAAIREADPNQKHFYFGLVLLFVGLTWWRSVFMALTIVGAVLVADGVITSYLVAMLSASRKE